MLDIFAGLLDTAAAASIFIAVILLIKHCCPRLSGRVRCYLWELVGLRLALPFRLVRFPERSFPAAPHAAENPVVRGVVRLTSIGTAATATEAAASAPGAAVQAAARSFDPRFALVGAWLLGTAAILAYSAVSYTRLRSRLATATICERGVYQSDAVSAPFIFGVIRPRIYVPYSVSAADIPYALEHEKTHIQRRDHIAKALAFVLLAVYWFDPLVWAAFISYCRDIELACDERVIARMERSERRLYSAALLSCSADRPVDSILGRTSAKLFPVAFGEIGVKERIIKIMKYQRPTFSAKALAAALCVILAVGMMILPIGGCVEKPAAPAAAPAVSDSTAVNGGVDDSAVEVNIEPAYSELETVKTDKGTNVTMHYCFESDTSGGFAMYFDFGEECTKVIASCTDGTMAKVNMDGSSDLYELPRGNTTESHSHYMCWTPQVIEGNDILASGDAVINVTACNADGDVLYEDTVNVTRTEGEFDGDYTFEFTKYPVTVGEGGEIVYAKAE